MEEAEKQGSIEKLGHKCYKITQKNRSRNTEMKDTGV